MPEREPLTEARIAAAARDREAEWRGGLAFGWISAGAMLGVPWWLSGYLALPFDRNAFLLVGFTIAYPGIAIAVVEWARKRGEGRHA